MRYGKLIAHTTPDERASASSSSASGAVRASGFSQSTGRPRSIAMRACSRCSASGPATTTASTRSHIAATSTSARAPDGRAAQGPQNTIEQSGFPGQQRS
ncbi:MAG: hypothetical protein M3Y87_21475 [Myxococcota bacterium]|nr:hypothetical protein [Myxococcota bacterium]